MQRRIIQALKKWQHKPNRKPLIIQGARQVGKTWAMKHFGETCFAQTAYINFDHNPRMQTLFSGDYNISRLLLLAMLNREKADVDLVVIVSDNESWADLGQWGGKTGLMKEWDILKQRCPEAKLVCLDIQPYTTAQAQNRRDILNIGGFSDQVFTLIGSFAEQGMGADFWVEEIEKTELAAVC